MRPFAWSMSRLKGFETCPRRHHEVDILKRVKDPPSPDLEYGNRVHKQLEEYGRSEGALTVDEDIRKFTPLVDKILALPGRKFFEVKLAIDENLEAVPFFDKAVWFRTVVDVLVTHGPNAIVVDWKTGKVKPENGDQLALNAACLFAHYPRLENIAARFYWLSQKDTPPTEYRYTRDKSHLTWHKFSGRVKVYRDAHDKQAFPPKPGGLCRKHCPVKSCEFNGT